MDPDGRTCGEKLEGVGGEETNQNIWHEKNLFAIKERCGNAPWVIVTGDKVNTEGPVKK